MAEKKSAGKKPGKKHQKLAQAYTIEGGTIKKKNKSCPKCGPGTFMGDHTDRWACGSCGYMEKKK